MKRVLVLLAEGFEELEAAAPVDIWRRFGWKVVTAMVSPHPSLAVTGQQGLVFKADIPLNDAYVEDFDMVFLPGGRGHKVIADSPEAGELLQNFVSAGKVLCAVCAAPSILAAKGWLAGRHAAVYPSYKEEIEKAGALYSDKDVVIDGQFITGRGAGAAAKLAFTVAATVDKEKAQSLADTMQFN